MIDAQNIAATESGVAQAIAPAVETSSGEPEAQAAINETYEPDAAQESSAIVQEPQEAAAVQPDLSIERLDKLPSFHRLTGEQSLLILHYLTNGGTSVEGHRDAKILAVQKVYGPMEPTRARLDSYRHFNNRKVEHVLDEFFGTSFHEQIVRELDRAIRNPQTSVGQVEAIRLKLDLAGSGLVKPGVKSEPKSESNDAA